MRLAINISPLRGEEYDFDRLGYRHCALMRRRLRLRDLIDKLKNVFLFERDLILLEPRKILFFE